MCVGVNNFKTFMKKRIEHVGKQQINQPLWVEESGWGWGRRACSRK